MLRRLTTRVLIVLGMIILAGILGAAATLTKALEESRTLAPKDLGGGIYSFSVNMNSESEVWKKSFTKFKKDHRIIAVIPGKQDGWGVITEILVVVEPK